MQLTPELLIIKSLKLASPPAIYQKLDALISDPESSNEDIGALIKSDPSLTARLLKIVNTPYYGYAAKIDDITRAVMLIGTRELKMMVLATCVTEAFDGIPASMVDLNDFWRHSMACALAAGIIAQHTNHTNPQQAVSAGLLHDIGFLVLCQAVPDLTLRAVEATPEKPLHEAEVEVIGFDHGVVGATLIRKWGLPESLADIIEHHHQPFESKEQQSMNALISVADAIALHVADGQHEEASAILDETLLNAINLSPDLISPIIEKVTESLLAMNYH